VWQPLGEPGSGGRISSIAVSPYDPQRILVGGDMLGVGLSENGGRSWESTSGFSSWEINDFTWVPGSPSSVWVGTLSGPYLSTDGGHTWTAKRSGLPPGDYPYSAPVQKVVIDPRNPNHLLAFGGNQSQFKQGGPGALNYGFVYQSWDGGNDWTTLSSVGFNLNILDVVHPAADVNTLYLAVLGHGILKSVDGGKTWQTASAGLPGLQVVGLAIDPTQPNTLWAALDHSASQSAGTYSPGGIYKTTNEGQTWALANGGLPQNASSSASMASSMPSVFRAADGSLYTADQGYMSQGRFSSTDGGATWTQERASFDKFYPAEATPYVWASSSTGGLVVGGSSDTIMGSSNHGQSWQDLGSANTASGGWRGNGFSGLLGTRAAFSPTQRGVVFLTAFDAGNLLRGSDGGGSWTRPLAGWDNWGGGYDVSVGGRSGGVVYTVLGQAGSFNGVAVSSDSGQNWTTHVGGVLPERNAFGGGQGSVAIASSDGATAYVVAPDGNLYRTTDTGTTWSLISLSSAAHAVAYAPGSGVTYMATGAGVEQISAGGTVSLMPGSPATLVRLVAGADGSVYGSPQLGSASAGAGLWHYAAGSWGRLATNPWVSDVAIDPHNPRHVVYVTNDNPYHATSFATGAWVSCNGGSTFAQYNNGLPMLRLVSVTFDPLNPGRVVVGTNGRGFWQSTLPQC